MLKEENRVYFHEGITAIELHRGILGCQVFVFAGGKWHGWDLPCKEGAHETAHKDDLREKIIELETKEN